MGTYDNIVAKLSEIDDILDNQLSISDIDVTDLLNDAVNTFCRLDKESKNKSYEVKSYITKLKNKQICIYNLMVCKLNERIGLIKKTSLEDKYDELKNLELMKYSDGYVGNDWKNVSYCRSLDYALLQANYNKLDDVNLRYHIFDNSVDDVKFYIDYGNYLTDELKNNTGNTEIFINKYLCLFDLIINAYFMIDKLESNKDLDLLFDNLHYLRNQVMANNRYDNYKRVLELLKSEVLIFYNKIWRNKGKFNYYNLDIYKKRIFDSLKLQYMNVYSDIDNDTLDDNQKNNLLDFTYSVNDILFGKVIVLLLDDSIFDDNDVDLDDIIRELNDKLDALLNQVNNIIDDSNDVDSLHDIRARINEYEYDINTLDMMIHRFNLDNLRDDWKKLRSKVDDIKVVLKIKYPCRVVKVSNYKGIYSKKERLCFEICGLSLLSIKHNKKLLPAIMDVSFKTNNNETNNLSYTLGSVLGAKFSDGEWVLPNGFLIGRECSQISLLESLSSYGKSNISLLRKCSDFGKKIYVDTDKITLKSDNNSMGFIDNSHEVFQEENVLDNDVIYDINVFLQNIKKLKHEYFMGGSEDING